MTWVFRFKANKQLNVDNNVDFLYVNFLIWASIYNNGNT